MKIIFSIFILLTTMMAKADFLCDLEYQKVGCKKDNPQCLIGQLNRIEKKCHAEITDLIIKSADNDPCYQFIKDCGKEVSEECLRNSPPQCQKLILDADTNEKLLMKECNFDEMEKNCPLDTSNGGLGDMQKQLACFNEHKYKLGTSCLNILEQMTK